VQAKNGRAQKDGWSSMSKDIMKCPECGNEMIFIHGCGWDYDRWVCMYSSDDFRLCIGEIELEETTYPIDS